MRPLLPIQTRGMGDSRRHRRRGGRGNQGHKKQSASALPLVPYLRVANVQRGTLILRLSPRSGTRGDGRASQALAGRRTAQRGRRPRQTRPRMDLGGQIPDCIHQNHVFRARIREGNPASEASGLVRQRVRTGLVRGEWQTDNDLASISLSMIKTLPIPVPPLAEQQRIVDLLEGIFPISTKLWLLLGGPANSSWSHRVGSPREMESVSTSLVPLGSLLREQLINGRSVPTRELASQCSDSPRSRPATSILVSARVAHGRQMKPPLLGEQGDFLLERQRLVGLSVVEPW